MSDELTATLCLAIQRLPQIKKAEFLLNTALALIEDGQYGEEVEGYFDICLKTPGLPKGAISSARRSTRKLVGGDLQCNPSNTQNHFSVCQRIPPEIWDQIAAQIPRYHLRTWLSISPTHREIASRHLFHTVDISFLEFDNLDRGLDILERATNDPVFASWVKSLRLHWDFEEGDVVDVLCHIVARIQSVTRHGTPEMPVEMVQVLLNTHKHLQGLNFKGRHLDAIAASTFQNLRKFTFRMDELDEEADLQDIRNVLDWNKTTLKSLILGGPYIDEDDPWDLVFESVTIEELVHLHLFSSDISCSVLDRITHAVNLQSLTLHGSFLEPIFASELLASTLFPHLESFGFVMDDQDGDLCETVAWHLVGKREKLRRLNLGSCPWDVVQDILPTLRNLRVLVVCIDELEQIESFVGSIPPQMVAIRLSVYVSDSEPLDEHAHHFARFNTLSFLHLEISPHPEKPKDMSKEDFQMQTDKTLRTIVAAVPSLDFFACYGKLYIVTRSHGDMHPTVELKEIPKMNRLEYGSGVDTVSEDIAWLLQSLDEEPREF